MTERSADLFTPGNGTASRADQTSSTADPAAAAAVRHAVQDVDLALRLPDWDLIPPTEFVRRQPLR